MPGHTPGVKVLRFRSGPVLSFPVLSHPIRFCNSIPNRSRPIRSTPLLCILNSFSRTRFVVPVKCHQSLDPLLPCVCTTQRIVSSHTVDFVVIPPERRGENPILAVSVSPLGVLCPKRTFRAAILLPTARFRRDKFFPALRTGLPSRLHAFSWFTKPA